MTEAHGEQPPLPEEVIDELHQRAKERLEKLEEMSSEDLIVLGAFFPDYTAVTELILEERDEDHPTRS